MLIEFSCPACKAQLSVEDKVAGRKVDCPKCKELIIIPMATETLPKGDASLPDADVLRSVIPYRSEMMTKHNKLLEAIEEIKLRNERIRELESSSLRIQKELWAIEVEFEQRKDTFDKADKEKRDLKKKLNQLGAGGTSSGGAAQSEIKALQHELDVAQRQITTLEKELKSKASTSGELTKAQQDAEKERDEKLKSLAAELEEADKINMALKSEISGLTIGIHQRDAIANQAYQQIQQALQCETAVKALEKSSAQRQETLGSQDELITSMVADAEKLAQQVKQLDQTLPALVADSQKKRGKASPREDKLAATVKELTDALAKSRASENKALEKYSQLEDRYKSLENKLENDRSANERLAKITTSYTALEKEHLSLEKKHETVIEENTHLKANAEQLKNLEQLEAENVEYVTRIAEQENELKELQATIEQLKSATATPAAAPAASAAKKGKAKDAKAPDGAYTDELKELHDRLSKLEITSDELATENARLKNTVRTLTENLKAQWKKRDTRVNAR